MLIGKVTGDRTLLLGLLWLIYCYRDWFVARARITLQRRAKSESDVAGHLVPLFKPASCSPILLLRVADWSVPQQTETKRSRNGFSDLQSGSEVFGSYQAL